MGDDVTAGGKIVTEIEALSQFGSTAQSRRKNKKDVSCENDAEMSLIVPPYNSVPHPANQLRLKHTIRN